MDNNNNNNNQIENANQNQNEMKNLEKKVTKNLIKNYSNLLNGNSFKDFSIFVENKSNPFEIKVHKSILCSRSPFFNESLRQESLSISLNQFNKKEMESILNSISKQDFDKLKQFDFFPKSFLVDIQTQVIQDNQKEIEDKNKEIEKNQKEIEEKEKENQQMKIEIEEKWKKEIENKNKEIEEKEKENQQMKPIFDKYQDQYQKEKELGKAFSESEIIKDIEYVKKLQEWINDNDFFSKMKKGFSAKRDGFDSKNWHKAVDGKGKTLVIIKTKDNFIFGGFTQVGFKYSQNGEYSNDPNAFIFSLRNDKGDRIPEKFTIKQGKEQWAIYSCFSSYGPAFSGHSGLWLNSNLGPCITNCGEDYQTPNGMQPNSEQEKSYLAGSYDKWVVDEVETYFI
ncbi:hypothetical protein M0811_08894 [Anaeramoeba ignava]|uniref:TLDc domain-containing protein n=1 Tax=Anaeramoeba ignava TaxID=1746090 RepID=A0A9Q0RAK8_ANAIG|nr:hypothetical protein M0811_08894 [Anaeramoeba ignava]